jgi:hypothetical protein
MNPAADNFEAHFAHDLPADDFVNQVISALTVSDAAALHQLESAVSSIAPPRSRAQYLQKRATFAALLDASARNLRLLRHFAHRGAQKPAPDIYAPRPQ